MTVVHDPFGAVDDPALPTLRHALDPGYVERRFKYRLPRLAGERGVVRVKGIHVIRHKPERRCLVDYDLRIERPDEPRTRARVLGKVRAGRFGNAGYDLAEALWRAGFDESADDGIVVPEPIATVPEFRMWLQRNVGGQPATDLVHGPEGVLIARWTAEAAYKLHESCVVVSRTHTIVDELRILHECLAAVASRLPPLTRRIGRLSDASERIAARMPASEPRPIHRDFYADQVIVRKRRLYVVDLDLFCMGDRALDIGNFLGHLTEQALRVHGDPAALAAPECELEERYCELAGERVRPAIHGYALLTLARHVYLSILHADRRHLTGSLLELCEERTRMRANARP